MPTRFFLIVLMFATSPFMPSARCDQPVVGDAAGPSSSGSERPDFIKQIRPILSDHCFACHGPDEADRKADLRLDVAEGVESVVQPGDVDASELIRRLRASDPDEIMPPPHYGKPLSTEQKKVLEAWVDHGAEFKGHWAFEPAVKNTPPATTQNPIDGFINHAAKSKGLSLNDRATDQALLRRVCLDLTGLPPNRALIQRVRQDGLDYESLVDELLASPAFGQHFGRYWLDLVRYADTHGLHLDNYREMWPYRDWVIDAINDNMPFDQFVTEQLAGDLIPNATMDQRIASGFNRLNVTTSEGGSIYEEVFARNVIDRTDAFGTIFLGLTTQCAVCHDHKFDPISQREYYSLFAFFNSLDGRALDGNKKDPAPVISVPTDQQTDAMEELERQLVELKQEMRQPIESVDAAQREWEASLAADTSQEMTGRSHLLVPIQADSKNAGDLVIQEDASVRRGEAVAENDVHTILASLELPQANWQSVHLEVLPDPKTDRVGVSGNGNAVLSEIKFETRDSDGKWHPLVIESAIADIEQENGEFAVRYAVDGKNHRSQGWAVAGHQHNGGRHASFHVPALMDRIQNGHDQIRVQMDYQSEWGKHQFYAVRFHLADSKPQLPAKDLITVGDVHLVGPFPVESTNPGFYRNFGSQQSDFDPQEVFPYSGREYRWQKKDDWSPVAVHRLPVEGESVAVNLIHHALQSPKKQSITLLLGVTDGHVVFLNKKRIGSEDREGPMSALGNEYKLDLNKGHNDLYIKTVSASRNPQLTYAFRSPLIALPEGIIELVRQDPDSRSDEAVMSLRTYYRQTQCSHPDWTALSDMAKGIEKAKQELQNEMATTLVWKELETPREAKVLLRGQYDQPGETVSRDVPAFLPSIPEHFSKDRMGLAKWLTLPDHPLTARVAVNRYWQSLFGQGIVRSSEDFGSQGDPPSHPELLDFLAMKFIASGWDVKRMIKLMVTSDAYQRDAAISKSQLAIDPANRYYARGPRHRLDGEVLRDQALALAGLLNKQFSGPSVKPPQPAGLWYAVGYTRSNTANFKADPEPEKQFRRSVYIFWKRTSAPPQMSTFDAPSRESCTARRERTNTPLQALLLLNEHQYLQAAKHLAARVFTESGVDDGSDRLAWLFETVTARQPSSDEVDELRKLLNRLREHYSQNTDAASELLAVDEIDAEGIAPEQHAAWMMIASTLLNLDEAVNK